MRYLNIEFQEEYKRLDALCKDLFSSYEGVSEYIREMEATPYSFNRLVPDWNSCYQQLKRMRYIRNKLAHEVGTFDCELCTENDLNWVKAFHTTIINRNDPLAVVRQIQQAQYRQQQTQTNPTSVVNKQYNSSKSETKKDSCWKRFIAKIKSFFS